MVETAHQPKAYAYSRFSSRAQGSGDSLRRQLKSCFAWAERHGLELDTKHQDRGVSAFSGFNRVKGALGSFLAKVESGEIPRGSFLLVDSLDRLSRENETRVLNMLTNLTLAGIKVVNVAEDHVLDESADMMDYMRVLIHAARSHAESVEKGRKIAEAHVESKRRAREEGRIWHKSGPRWLNGVVTGVGKSREIKFVEIEDRVRIVKRVFNLIEEGFGTSAIALRFNEDKEPTPRDGNGWHHSTVLEIAKNRAVLGEYQPKLARKGDRASRRPKDGEARQNYYPQIIDPAQFHRVQAIIKSRAPKSGRRANRRVFSNLFMGIGKCQECDGTVGIHVTTSDGRWKRNSVLKCNNAGRGRCSNKRRYPYDRFEAAVLKHVSEFDIPSSKQEDRFTGAIAKLVGEREEAEHRRSNIMALAEESGDREFVARHAELRARVEELDRQIGKLRDEQQEAGLGIPIKARQEALQGLIDKLASAEGSELYSLRAAISVALRGVIEIIRFSDLVSHGDITLIMRGRKVIYKFDQDLGIFSRLDLDWIRKSLDGKPPTKVPQGFTVDA